MAWLKSDTILRRKFVVMGSRDIFPSQCERPHLPNVLKIQWFKKNDDNDDNTLKKTFKEN